MVGERIKDPNVLRVLNRAKPEELKQIRTRVIARINQPLELHAWFRYEAVVTPDGYRSCDEVIRQPMEYNKQRWEEEE